jgi:hypothetical protein
MTLTPFATLCSVALVMLAHCRMFWATFALIGIAFGASGSPI